MRLDLDRLEELARLMAVSTPGPWEFNPRNGIHTPRGECIALTHNGLHRSPDAALIVGLVNAAPSLLAAARAVQRVEAALDILESETPGEMLVLPPEHHACEREVTRLVVVALRAALGGAGRVSEQAETHPLLARAERAEAENARLRAALARVLETPEAQESKQ